jgi:hypothetical protein
MVKLTSAVPWVLAVLGLAALVAGVSLWVSAYTVGSVNWPTTITAISNVVQSVVLIAGALWSYHLFVRQRLGHPRANLELRVDFVAHEAAHRFVRVTTWVHNIGSVSIHPPVGSVALYQILPLAPDRVASLEAAAAEGDDSERVEPTDYPSLGTRTVDLKADEMVLDPGEDDYFAVDFIIPAEVVAVLVESTVECGAQKKQLSWSASALLRVDAASGTFTSRAGA